MELTQIKYFLAVAQTLNFTKAAEECSVSQPALSKAIRKLESSLGADLFDRTSQQVELTEFGRTMLVHFERIEESRRRARDAARIAAGNGTASLDVGVMCTIGPVRFSRFLNQFQQMHPEIEVTLHDVVGMHIPELLLSGAIDCVFCARATDHDQRFRAIQLFSEKMVVAFHPGHRFETFDTVPLAEVAGELYLDRLHCEFRNDFFEAMRASGLELNVMVRSEKEDWILDLIHNGAGISVIPRSSIIDNRVNYRPVTEITKSRQLELVHPHNDAESSALILFTESARQFLWE